MVQFAVTNAPGGTLYFPLLAITVIVNPLQGMFNALIYIRPRYLRYRKKQREEQNGVSPGGRLSGSFSPNSSDKRWQNFVQAVGVKAMDEDEDEWEEQAATSGDVDPVEIPLDEEQQQQQGRGPLEPNQVDEAPIKEGLQEKKQDVSNKSEHSVDHTTQELSI